LSSSDIGGLRALVTARQQNHHVATLSREVHPITGAVIDPQLGNTLANRFGVTGIPGFQARYPRLNRARA
jgi:hypothetical protein